MKKPQKIIVTIVFIILVLLATVATLIFIAFQWGPGFFSSNYSPSNERIQTILNAITVFISGVLIFWLVARNWGNKK